MKTRQLIIAASLLLLFAQAAESKSVAKAWLRGTWEGTGYQIDDASLWPMRLTISRTKRGRKFSIEYPSLNCGGTWKLLRLDQNKATFREQLSHGQDKCSDNGLVVIERKRNQLVFLYSLQGARELEASAILNRKTPPKTN
jgi:hypothetical protein